MRLRLLALSLATICAPAVALAQSNTSYVSQPTPGTLLAQAQEFEVYFPLGKSTLSADASATIAQAAQEYQRTGQAKIAVRGHTDTSGSTERNQVLSERRAKAVSDELVRLGVPADAIAQEALGETDLAVPTPKGVREAKNRRVQIIVEAPPPPPPPAPAPAPKVAEAPPPPPPPAPKRWLISIGPFYGYVTGNGYDNTSHLAGLNFSIDYAVLPWLGIGAEQAGFYNFDDEHEHRRLASRSAGSLNLLLGHYSMGDMDVVPYFGGNFGYATSKGIHDDLFAGPELGVFVGPFIGKAAYDIPLHAGIDGGNLAVTLGFGFRF